MAIAFRLHCYDEQYIGKLLNNFTAGEMDAECPLVFDGMKGFNSQVLLQLPLHLNHHLGR